MVTGSARWNLPARLPTDLAMLVGDNATRVVSSKSAPVDDEIRQSAVRYCSSTPWKCSFDARYNRLPGVDIAE
jgi:hypothetical protein